MNDPILYLQTKVHKMTIGSLSEHLNILPDHWQYAIEFKAIDVVCLEEIPLC